MVESFLRERQRRQERDVGEEQLASLETDREQTNENV
jgi:hypothetical protein